MLLARNQSKMNGESLGVVMSEASPRTYRERGTGARRVLGNAMEHFHEGLTVEHVHGEFRVYRKSELRRQFVKAFASEALAEEFVRSRHGEYRYGEQGRRTDLE